MLGLKLNHVSKRGPWCVTTRLFDSQTLPSLPIRHPNSMMTSSNGKFSALLALCVGNSPVTGEFPSQRPVTRSFDVFFDQKSCFNMKMRFYRYKKSHCGDKTILGHSYLLSGISYTGKTSLYWIRAQVLVSITKFPFSWRHHIMKMFSTLLAVCV